MTLLQTFIPIIYDSGSSAPMTESDVNEMVACWIILNALWVLSFIITGIRYIIFLKSKESKYQYFESRLQREPTIIFDVLMIAFWAIILLVEAGKWLSTLIF